MLRGKLTLHDVRDTEALCARVLERAQPEQSHHEREDSLAYLIETAWELSLDFRAGEASFSTYLSGKLRQRLVDWQRQTSGRTRWQFADRTYERRLPTFVVLDDGLPGSLSGPDRRSDEFRRYVSQRGRYRTRHKRVLTARACERSKEAVAV